MAKLVLRSEAGEQVAVAAKRAIKVLVATPFGRGGRGGIDRIMDALDGAVKANGLSAKLDIVPTRGKGPIIWAPFYLCTFIYKLCVKALLGRVDIVHINVAQHGSVIRKEIIASVCSFLGVPYVVHIHGSSFHRYWEESAPHARRRLSKMLEQAGQVIVLGQFWRDFVSNQVHGARERLVIVPNASPHPAAHSMKSYEIDGQVRILFLGRLGHRKGTPQLIEALHLLAHEPNWNATIAGDGALDETLSDVTARGLLGRIDLPGWVDSAQVTSLLQSADILVLPSFDENLPMSVIEAMGYGIAIVTTPVGAVPDIIFDGETGLLVPPGNPPALANAINRLIKDRALRDRLGRAARAFHAENLELSVYAHRIESVWRKAITMQARQ